MADEPRYRTLIEMPEYTAQVISLERAYSPDAIGSAIMGLLWGISTNPERYEKVTGNISQAKSRSFDSTIPSIRIFFQIKNENEVLLLWAEETSSMDEIMGT